MSWEPAHAQTITTPKRRRSVDNLILVALGGAKVDHAGEHVYIHTCIHVTCIHTKIHAYMHTCVHAYMHTHTTHLTYITYITYITHVAYSTYISMHSKLSKGL